MNPSHPRTLDPADLPEFPTEEIGPGDRDWWSRQTAPETTLGLPEPSDGDFPVPCPEAVRAFAGACYRGRREGRRSTPPVE